MVLLLHKYSKDCIVPPYPWGLLELARSSTRGPERQTRPYERAKRLTPEQVDQLVARYNEIKSMRLVAREFGLDRATVRERLWRSGITIRKTHSMDPDQKDRAKKLYLAGFSSAYIGKRLGFDNHTVLKELRMAGIVIRHTLR